jgi:hypothetical protein
VNRQTIDVPDDNGRTRYMTIQVARDASVPPRDEFATGYRPMHYCSKLKREHHDRSCRCEPPCYGCR